MKNLKLLLAATNGLRQTLETSLKLHQAMRDIQAIDDVHAIIMEEIGRESPATAEPIMRRMQIMTSSWDD